MRVTLTAEDWCQSNEGLERYTLTILLSLCCRRLNAHVYGRLVVNIVRLVLW